MTIIFLNNDLFNHVFVLEKSSVAKRKMSNPENC